MNCTNALPVSYRNGNETFVGVVYTTNEKAKCMNVARRNGTEPGHRNETAIAEHEREHATCLDFCCHRYHREKNETMTHEHKNETMYAHKNATIMHEHSKCMHECHRRHGKNETMQEHHSNNSTFMHEHDKNSTAHTEAASIDQPSKRTEDKNLNDEAVPACVRALEKGPVIRSVSDRVVSAFRGAVGFKKILLQGVWSQY